MTDRRDDNGRIDTLLLDLDGTLLDIDMMAFLRRYFTLLATPFPGAGSRERFRHLMLGAVRRMMDNLDPARRLDSIFLEEIAPGLGESPEAVREKFRVCHLSDLEGLRHVTRTVPAAGKLVESALRLGYRLVLATNPVFFPEAIAARLRWAGLRESDFHFISSSENMHFCKPHREYFMEVLRRSGATAGQAVMAGNDPDKDMPAATAGLDTFLVHLHRPSDWDGGAQRRGRLEDVLAWIEELGAVV